MDAILDYLTNTYHPLAMIGYGSYANGTQNAQSDFDVLLICRSCPCRHDGRVIVGVRLDAVLRTPQEVLDENAPQDLITVHDGVVLLENENHIAQGLIDRVRVYAAAHAVRDADEKRHLRQWSLKMLERAARGDAEGLYRAHWLLTDSLEIYCVMRDRYYFGPKKTIRAIEAQDPAGYALLEGALHDLSCLQKWTEYALQTTAHV